MVQLGRLKAQLVELASLQVSCCFQSEGVEIEEEEIQQIAAMHVEFGSVDFSENFIPSRFTKRTASLVCVLDSLLTCSSGDRTVSMQENFWDLLKKSDVRGLCHTTAFSVLLNISEYGKSDLDDEWRRTGQACCGFAFQIWGEL